MSTARPTPQGLPMLDSGSHRRPEDGSCLMEYVSVLAGRRFGDRPRCTDPTLARLARLVNDGVGDDVRPRLAVLAADLTRARGPAGRVRAVVLAHLADAGLAVRPDDRWLLRMRRQVAEYRGGGTGRTRRAWRRVTMAADTTFALGHVASLVAHADPAERDARMVGLLTDATRAVCEVGPHPRAGAHADSATASA